MKDWDTINLPTLSDEYLAVRNDIESIFNNVKSTVDVSNKYQFDLRFGAYLKEYLDSKDWFTVRLSSNLDFWRYLSVYVIPHLVYERWEEKADDRYWKKPARIWLRSIWWFAYLGWNSDVDGTIKLLSADNLNTDVILNTVERTGRKGTHIETYRSILHIYAELDPTQLKQYMPKSKSETLFRAVMKLNTAKLLVLEPSLCTGGADGYARNLYRSLGIQL